MVITAVFVTGTTVVVLVQLATMSISITTTISPAIVYFFDMILILSDKRTGQLIISESVRLNQA